MKNACFRRWIAWLKRHPKSENQLQPSQRVRDIRSITAAISKHTKALSQHLMAHLEKEETQCMPLVAQHLSKAEIHDLVGKIMGKRSADTIAQIMTMAVQNLNEADRLEMVKYMKQAMSGTFFDRWLLMSGWMSTTSTGTGTNTSSAATAASEQELSQPSQQQKSQPVAKLHLQHHGPVAEERKREARPAPIVESNDPKRPRVVPDEDPDDEPEYTSQEELEKFIRAIATNPGLTPEQKNATIQGLRDSVWKSNQRQRALQAAEPTLVNATGFSQPNFPPTEPAVASVATCRTRRVTPPSMYFKKNAAGKIELVWTSESPSTAAAVQPTDDWHSNGGSNDRSIRNDCIDYNCFVGQSCCCHCCCCCCSFVEKMIRHNRRSSV